MDVRDFIITLLFLSYPDYSRCVRLLELRVPAHAAAEGEALLGCQFDMESDMLYSVKWYKDGREFYRYVPKNKRQITHFHAPGVYVDLARSYSNMVTLVNLKRESAGVYKCEVSGEAPLFTTVSEQKYVTIHVLPETEPRIIGLRNDYKVGDWVAANCTSSGSRPEAQLKWLINGHSASRAFVQGPWYRILNPPDTTETTLQLKFITKTFHFKNGVMELKCQATIAPLYQQETVYTVSHPSITTPGPDPQSAVDKDWRDQNFHSHFSHIIEPPSPAPIDDTGAAARTEKPLAIMLHTVLLLLLSLIVLH